MSPTAEKPVIDQGLGASAEAETGSRASMEPASSLRPSGFDPARFQYRFSTYTRENGETSERHDWCLTSSRGGITIWAEPTRDDSFGDRWFGGVECHWASPPDYFRDTPPHRDHCWLIGKPCWHDGSSLFFSERIEPNLPAPTGKQMDSSLNGFLLHYLRDWFGDKIASGIEAPSGVETGHTDSTEGESPVPKGDAQP